MAEPMTPWDHIREAEHLAAKAGNAPDPIDVIAWSHLALAHIELAKAKDLMAEPGPIGAAVNAPAPARTVGRVHSLYPLDLP